MIPVSGVNHGATLAKAPRLVVGAHDAGARLDQWLGRVVPELSRNEIRSLLEAGGVRRATGSPARKGDRVSAGEAYELDLSRLDRRTEDERAVLIRKRRDLVLLALGESWGVVRKPAGLGSVPAFRGDVLCFSRYARELLDTVWATPGESELPDAGLLHRLDHGTSGACVVARTRQAHAQLLEQRHAGVLQRTYWAIVAGDVPDRGTLDAPICHHASDDRRMVLARDGGRGKPQPASTEYRVLARSAAHALVEVEIRGGRRHQVRLHLASVGYPLRGDALYGGTQGPRLALHAQRVRFVCPDTGRAVEAQAEAGLHFWSMAPGLAEAMP